MLEGNNTTISIAHRLSTIQRSDSIICFGADGKVAQVGSYADLSADKEGAFAKLMEWQMSGGSAPTSRKGSGETDPGLSEEEEIEARLEESDGDVGYEADVKGEEVGEGTRVGGEKETAAEAVLERTKSSDR